MLLVWSMNLLIAALQSGLAWLASGGATPWSATLAAAPLLTVGLIVTYGYYEAHRVRVETYEISTPKLSAGTGRVRVVQISDLHLSKNIRRGRVHRLIREIQDLHPDIVVSTGDLLDGHVEDCERFLPELQALQAPGGKFAVMGNHEHYPGLEKSIAFHRRAGFTVLRNQSRDWGAELAVAGMEDPPKGAEAPPDGEALRQTDPRRFVLLLKHRPRVDTEAVGRFDLQLSGHTHRGQVFPLNVLTRWRYPYHAGWYTLPRESALYVSRGTGTAGPSLRVFSPPELTVFDIQAEAA